MKANSILLIKYQLERMLKLIHMSQQLLKRIYVMIKAPNLLKQLLQTHIQIKLKSF